MRVCGERRSCWLSPGGGTDIALDDAAGVATARDGGWIKPELARDARARGEMRCFCPPVAIEGDGAMGVSVRAS